MICLRPESPRHARFSGGSTTARRCDRLPSGRHGSLWSRLDCGVCHSAISSGSPAKPGCMAIKSARVHLQADRSAVSRLVKTSGGNINKLLQSFTASLGAVTPSRQGHYTPQVLPAAVCATMSGAKPVACPWHWKCGTAWTLAVASVCKCLRCQQTWFQAPSHPGTLAAGLHTQTSCPGMLSNQCRPVAIPRSQTYWPCVLRCSTHRAPAQMGSRAGPHSTLRPAPKWCPVLCGGSCAWLCACARCGRSRRTTTQATGIVKKAEGLGAR